MSTHLQCQQINAWIIVSAYSCSLKVSMMSLFVSDIDFLDIPSAEYFDHLLFSILTLSTSLNIYLDGLQLELYMQIACMFYNVKKNIMQGLQIQFIAKMQNLHLLSLRTFKNFNFYEPQFCHLEMTQKVPHGDVVRNK